MIATTDAVTNTIRSIVTAYITDDTTGGEATTPNTADGATNATTAAAAAASTTAAVVVETAGAAVVATGEHTRMGKLQRATGTMVANIIIIISVINTTAVAAG